jgi:regulator of protease activity HflC (stomatin/prohibitin superfamily)
MGLIVSAIAALFAFMVAYNGSSPNEHTQKIVRSLSLLIGILATCSFFYQLVFRFLVIIPAGQVGVTETFGKVSDKSIAPGVNWINPFSTVIEYSTRIKEIKETIDTTSLEGLTFNIDVSLQYRLQANNAATVYQNIGTDESEILIARFRSIVRQITAKYEAKSIYGDKREEIANKLKQELSKQLNPLGFVVEESLLRNVILPEKIQASIQQKIEAEQESERQQFVNNKKRQELDFELEKAQKEATRKKIEAQGIADSQKLISQGLTEQILELKAIEVTEKLAASQNAKIIVVGREKDGLPIILQNP